MSVINKPSANKSSLNQSALNRTNGPVQANTSFIDVAKNNINKTLSVASKSLNAPFIESLKADTNVGENAES